MVSPKIIGAKKYFSFLINFFQKFSKLNDDTSKAPEGFNGNTLHKSPKNTHLYFLRENKNFLNIMEIPRIKHEKTVN
jgi:hypothetical protein